jgi:enoyl-CoA hydratase
LDVETGLTLQTDRMIAYVDGAIGWMVFNNPARRNACSTDMWAAIPGIIDAFEANPAVRVVVLRGTGETAFVAGADISEFEKTRSSAAANIGYEQLTETAGKRLAECSKPTIAMIHGFCIGGGVALALGCDLRVTADDGKFGVPAVRLGLGYGPGGVKKLMDLVGPAFTKEIFFTARHFTADEAQSMGLVNRVVPKAKLESYIRNYCGIIADNAPMTINALKRTVAELAKLSLQADIEFCNRLVQECFDSQDFVEGRRAFLEKRRPVFQGR